MVHILSTHSSFSIWSATVKGNQAPSGGHSRHRCSREQQQQPPAWMDCNAISRHIMHLWLLLHKSLPVFLDICDESIFSAHSDSVPATFLLLLNLIMSFKLLALILSESSRMWNWKYWKARMFTEKDNFSVPCLTWLPTKGLTQLLISS